MHGKHMSIPQNPPPPSIEFSSLEGKKIFTEALAEGTRNGLFELISYYQTQSELAFYGLATLSVVLIVLAIDPSKKWKGHFSPLGGYHDERDMVLILDFDEEMEELIEVVAYLVNDRLLEARDA
ncbi:unnamed protein product [Vicia faba]|uniref:glutathione gamma-glutamylcysteinyltransferase n=1 Tax=Vicia faba TaxID=3906 RepID=A0AAV0ZR74_VICFA|nr:unnamed protein product [Vicia faba]